VIEMDKNIMDKLDEIISRLKVVEGEIEKLKRVVSGKNYFPWREPRPSPSERPYDDPYPYDLDRTNPYSPEGWRKRGRNPKRSDDEDDDDDDDGWGGIAPRQGR